MDAAPPLIATADTGLLDDLLRLSAAASVRVTTADSVDRALLSWPRSPMVVLGADLYPTLRSGERPPHARFVVVAREGGVGEGRVPGLLGAGRPLLLPRDENVLTGLLAAGGPAGRRAPTVAVVGGRGGAGASLLAVALALAGARGGHGTALLDADPLGCGPDILLGCERDPVERRIGWDDLVERRGRLRWSDVAPRLPGPTGISVLTWMHGPDPRRGPLPAGAARAMLDSARQGCDLVVVDLPRSFGSAVTAFLNRSDLVLLVVPAEVAAVVAASAMVPRLREESRELRAVVRGASGGLTADVVARGLGLPLGADLPPEPGLARTLTAGRRPADHPRSPLAGFADRLVADLTGVPR
ncbi:septum site-determining protein Ssd [Nocardiopsis lambiniae]|uniref:Septum site determining protein n=1 Tax=Nocardiopsis lambiniae TaxID=3075539 RepID=A0ABU2MFT6_9ACTN|nr:septum site-determining protein Ssd [Nocardiopsis sp. DSM 44743]MDT0330935.1 septum site determining protein [Nocardiopsis sp. DSM 44743]